MYFHVNVCHRNLSKPRINDAIQANRMNGTYSDHEALYHIRS